MEIGEAPWPVQGFELVHLALYGPQEFCPGCAKDLSQQDLLPLGEQRRPWSNSTG